MRATLTVAIFGVLAAGCAAGRSAAMPPATMSGAMPGLLTWLAEFTRPAGAAYPELNDRPRFGGLSGLARDAQSGQWLAVIDDREGTRLVWLTIALAGGRLWVSPDRMTALRPGPGVPERIATRADLEAIAALPDGSFVMSEEGHSAQGEVWQPAILHVTRDGLVTALTEFPDAFRIHPDRRQGPRDNQGIESLARTPGGRLIAGLEQPLIQDGERSSFESGGRGRLLEFVPRGRDWRVGRQWAYAIGRTPRVEGFEAICNGGENGLVDLLALTETLLLSLERACLRNPVTGESASAIQIFTVDLAGAEARKTLTLDLATLAPRLSPALAWLDNFEALAFGPPAADGGKTVIVMSDDNFVRTQNTAFLLFALR